MTFNFTHLHTVYSLSDSLITSDKLIKRLKELNMNKVAITDHGNLLHIQEYRHDLSSAGIQHFPGEEFYYCNDVNNKEQRASYHLVAIAKTEQGVKNLYSLSSLSYEKGFYYRPRIDFSMIEKYNEGLIFSSACLKGELDCLLLNNKIEEAYKCANKFKELLKDRYFIEIMPHNIPEQQTVNLSLIELGKKLNIPIVATCDSHYTYQDEASNRRMLLVMNKAGWAKDEEVGTCDTIYMMSQDDIKNTFKMYHQNIEEKLIDEAIDNTNIVLEGNAPNVAFDKARFPKVNIPEIYSSQEDYFNNLIINGLKDKELVNKKEYCERAQKEAQVIIKSGFVSYFIVMYDLFDWCRKNKVYTGAGRGCFLPGNKVHTTPGSYINIKNKKKFIGKRALTHDGEYHKVLNHFTYNVVNEDCIRLYLSNGKKIECTYDHKIFKKDIGFVPANMLKVNDVLLGIKTKNEKVVVSCTDCGKVFTTTAKFARMHIKYGNCVRKPGEFLCNKCFNHRVFSDPILCKKMVMPGALVNKRPEVKKKNSDTIKYLMRTTDLKQRISAGVKRAYKNDPTMIDRCTKNNGYKYGNFYSIKNSKNIFYQSSYELKALNIFETDSNVVSFDRCKFNIEYDFEGERKVYFPDFCVKYLNGITKIIEIKPNYKRNDSKTIIKKQYAEQFCKLYNMQFEMWFEDELGIQNDLMHNEIIITKIENFKYTGKVYDIEVEGVHNYTVSGVTVHNSAGGSLIAYLLGITKIDPIKYNLLFERFYNEGRNTGTAENAPDIDSDFESARREEVVKYLESKYGFENISQICSISYIKLKSGIKDVARALNISIDLANKISQEIPWEIYNNLDEAIEKDEKARTLVNKYPELFKYVKIFCGIPRQTGKHAAGLVIGDEKIGNVCPMMLATVNKEKFLISQFDKDSIKHTGLIKYDILGLTTMDFIKALDIQIKQETGNFVDWDNINLNDEKVYDNIFSAAQTNYVFQCDSNLMKSWLKKMKCKSIEDLSAMNTLVRPASLITGATDRYIKKRFGIIKDELNNNCEADKIFYDITKNTYGEIIYDEQKMLMVQQIGGISLKDANMVRKQPERWADKHDELQSLFLKNALEKGWDNQKAKLYWEMVKQYSFCKAHSMAYSILGFWCAWAKYYYPVAFMKAMFMTSSTDSSANKFNVIDAIKFALFLGYKVLPVNINKSKSVFTFDDTKKEVYFPFRSIKGISEEAGIVIQNNAPFKDFNNFIERCKDKVINKRVIMPLIELKAFDELVCSEQILNYYIKNYSLDKEDDNLLRSEIKTNKEAKLLTKEERVIYKQRIEQCARDNFDKIIKTPLFMLELKHLGIILSSNIVKYEDEIAKTNINVDERLDNEKFLISGFLTELKNLKSKKGTYYGYIELVNQNFTKYEIITRSNIIDDILKRDKFKLEIGQYVKAEVCKNGNRFFLEHEKIVALDDCI